MTTEKNTSSVARILTRLKHTVAGFTETVKVQWVDVTRGDFSAQDGRPSKEVIETIIGNKQSLDDKIEHILSTHLAIQRSNLDTRVIVGGKEMSVAEAIIIKNQIIPLLETWAREVQSQNVSAKNAYSRLVNEYDASIKGESPEVLAIRELKERPGIIAADKILADIKDRITLFKSDVDAALSESNSLTHIEL